MPGFSDSHWFRKAFGAATVYGFCPQRAMACSRRAPLIHGADERAAVADIELAAGFYADLCRRGCSVSEPRSRRRARNGVGATEPSPRRLRLGGMALRNGLLIHGPTSWAAAARAADGDDRGRLGAEADARAAGGSAESPLLRGPLRLAEAMRGDPAGAPRLRSARLPFEDRAVLGRRGRRDRRRAACCAGGARRRVGREAALAALGALPALAALRDRDLAAYHGVEHKAIGGYEQGARSRRGAEGARALRLEPDRADARALGRRPGAGRAAASSDPGPSPARSRRSSAVGAAVELFVFAERNPDSRAWPQPSTAPATRSSACVSTREPTAEQLEVGRRGAATKSYGSRALLPIPV